VVGEAVSIRRARPSEARTLSDLALRSKAHWGYDDAFLEACRRELTVRPDRIEHDVVAVLETPGGIEGFYLLQAELDAAPDTSGRSVIGAGSEGAAKTVPRAELELFYVDPASIGAGHGRRLWRHAVSAAREHGCRRIFIHSDPHAEGFYRAMGARHVGEVASGSIEGRLLPLMQFDLDADRRSP
jgi:GNAT superfamily N-acetyltransferase